MVRPVLVRSPLFSSFEYSSDLVIEIINLVAHLALLNPKTNVFKFLYLLCLPAVVSERSPDVYIFQF